MKKNLTRIETQILLECNAMTKYAFSSGLKVSGEIVKVLELYSVKAEEDEKPDDIPQKTPADSGNRKADSPDIGQLALIHGQLSDIIAPAKPSAILLLEKNESGFWKFLGPIPFIRRMFGMALICLILAVALCITDEVDGNSENFNLFHNEGIPLLLNILFLLASAGIGASFSALFTANSYITDRTFDPVFEATYWIRFVLGLMAGLLLAVINPLRDKNISGFGPSMLALLGGFSAVIAYRILNRMTITLESLIEGDAKDKIAARETVVKTRFEEKSSKERMQLSGMLTKFQSKLYSGASSDDLHKEIQQIQDSLSTPNAIPAGYKPSVVADVQPEKETSSGSEQSHNELRTSDAPVPAASDAQISPDPPKTTPKAQKK